MLTGKTHGLLISVYLTMCQVSKILKFLKLRG